MNLGAALLLKISADMKSNATTHRAISFVRLCQNIFDTLGIICSRNEKQI